MYSYIQQTLFTNAPGAWFCWAIIIVLLGFLIWLWKIAKSGSIAAKKMEEQIDESAENSSVIIEQLDIKSTTWKNYKNSLIETEVNENIVYQRSCPSSTFINPESVNPKLFKGYFLTWIPSVLTTLGVLGTFVGLSIGLQGLKLDSNGSNTTKEKLEMHSSEQSSDSNLEIEVMLDGIKELITGARTAFNTSIFGVTAGILFGISLRWTRQVKANEIRKLSDRLDELVVEVSSEKDLRDLKLSNDDASRHLKVLIEQIGPKLQETLVDMPKHIGSAIGAEIKGAVGSIGNQNAEVLGGALQYVYKEHLADLSGLAKSIQNQIEVTDTITDRLSSLPDKLVSSSQNLEKSASYLNSVSESFGEWDNSLNKYSQTLNSSSISFDNASKTLDKAALTIDNAVPNLEGAANNIQETASTTKTNIEEDTTKLTQSFSDVVEVMKGFKETSENLPEVADKLSKASENLNQLSRSMQASHAAQENASENNRRAAASFDKISGSFESTATHLSNLGNASENLNRAGVAAKVGFESLQPIVVEMRELKASFTRLADSFSDITDKEIGKQFGDASRALDQASEKLKSLTEASSSLNEASNTAISVFGSASEEHKTYIEGLTVGVAGLASELNQLLATYENGLKDSTKRRIEDWNTSATDFGANFKTDALNLHSAIEELQDSLNTRK